MIFLLDSGGGRTSNLEAQTKVYSLQKMLITILTALVKHKTNSFLEIHSIRELFSTEGNSFYFLLTVKRNGSPSRSYRYNKCESTTEGQLA